MHFAPLTASYEDLHAMFKELRENDPLYYWEAQGCWVVSRHEDIEAILYDTRFTVEGAMSAINAGYCPEARAVISRGIDWEEVPQLGSAEGEDLTRLRGVMQSIISPKRMKEQEPRIREIAVELIESLAPKGRCEFVSDFAFRFPIYAIFSLIGLSPQEHDLEQLQTWCDEMGKLFLGPLSPAGQVDAAKNAIQFQEYLRDVIADRRRNPRNDLLSDLIVEIDNDGRLNEDELIVMMAINMIAAGHETTKSAISNALFQLLRVPERWEYIKENPASIPSVVEETFRLDSAATSWYRIAGEDIELHGKVLPKGARIIMLLASANHDEKKFANPDEFCPTRGVRNGHLTFTGGRHFCLGAPLARLELRIALEELSKRLPTLRLCLQNLEYEPLIATRVLKSLHLDWSDTPAI